LLIVNFANAPNNLVFVRNTRCTFLQLGTEHCSRNFEGLDAVSSAVIHQLNDTAVTCDIEVNFGTIFRRSLTYRNPKCRVWAHVWQQSK